MKFYVIVSEARVPSAAFPDKDAEYDPFAHGLVDAHDEIDAFRFGIQSVEDRLQLHDLGMAQLQPGEQRRIYISVERERT